MWQALLGKNFLNIFGTILKQKLLRFGDLRDNFVLRELKEAIHCGYFNIWLNIL